LRFEILLSRIAPGGKKPCPISGHGFLMLTHGKLCEFRKLRLTTVPLFEQINAWTRIAPGTGNRLPGVSVSISPLAPRQRQPHRWKLRKFAEFPPSAGGNSKDDLASS
jgi:hypothetical protein